ncbi:hypothetical protein DM02DRAFT_615232 [Periconia macrospinosa]|uniref:F-box domain-containing protein n=1 Tax=Periconia macrospinosa TaxID=97972 RepID=A0A2V1DM75_9PLEO|nr:hypothetical protein DM02DRAFT_615232 [Periconia macrospinosa]
MPATSTALSITEILEQILSELPPFDILRFKRVNQKWHKIIRGSSLLQYKAWLREDYPDTAHLVRGDDLMPESQDYSDIAKEYEMRRYVYNLSKHLHPIVVARIMKKPPQDPSYCFEPDKSEENGYGGYLNLPPVLIRKLRKWYENNKHTEDEWGHMSLYRPHSRRIRWETPNSGGAGIPFELDVDFLIGKASIGHDNKSNEHRKRLDYLTLSDLFGALDRQWEEWLESERDEHFFSHDAGVCDLDMGLPAQSCLEYDSEDEDEDEENERSQVGYKMTMEEHIKVCLITASG